MGDQPEMRGNVTVTTTTSCKRRYADTTTSQPQSPTDDCHPTERLAHDRNNSAGMRQEQGPDVFLGGSCGTTVWRRDVAVPLLQSAGVTFYNPQKDDWDDSMIELEEQAKARASLLLFVIDDTTRALASMVEAASAISAGRKVILVVQKVASGLVISGDSVSESELKDMNRAREYLVNIARKRMEDHSNVALCTTIPEAVSKAISMSRTQRPDDTGCCTVEQ